MPLEFGNNTDVTISGKLETSGLEYIKFTTSDVSNVLGRINGNVDGDNGGELQFYTKVDGASSVTEKLRINNIGAIGIGGANFGTKGQILTSNGPGSAVSWVNPVTTTYTAGTGVSISPSNEISIGQEVSTTNIVTFNALTLSNRIVLGTNSGENVLYIETSKDYIFKNSIISTETLNDSYRILQTDANNEFVIVSYPNLSGHYLYTRFDNVRHFMNNPYGFAMSNRIGQAHFSEVPTHLDVSNGVDYVEVIIGDAEYDTRGSLYFYRYHKANRSYHFGTTLQAIGPHFANYNGFGSVLHGTEDNTTLFMIGDNTNSKFVIAFTRHPAKTWEDSFNYLVHEVGLDNNWRGHIVISQRNATSSSTYDRDDYHSFNSYTNSTDPFKWISSSYDGEFIVMNNPRLQQLYVFKRPEYMYTLTDSTQTNDITQITSGYIVNDYTIVQVINAEDFKSTPYPSVPTPPQYYYGPCNSGASIEGTIASHTIDYNYFSSQNNLLFGGAQEYNKVISPNGKVLALIDAGYKNSNVTIYGNSSDYVVGIIVILERSSTEDSNGNYVSFAYSQHFIGEYYSGVSSTSVSTTQFGEHISVGNDSIIASSGNSSLSQDQNKMYYINKNESGTWVVDNIPGPPYFSRPATRQIFANYDHNSIVTWSAPYNNANTPTYFYKDYNKSKVTSYNGEFTNVTANLLNTAYAPVVTSDDRYKINEEVINNGLESIRQLVPKRYLKTNKEYEANYMGNLDFGDKGTLESGLIAQEVNNIPSLSYLVKYENNRYSLCYNDLFVHNISATKELDTIVQQQAQTIANLEARLVALESS